MLNTRYSWFIVPLMLCVSFGSNDSFAFNKLGHQLVCDIAWQYLSPKARKHTRQLIKEYDYKTLAHACTWADKIRDKKRYNFSHPHHYMNVKRSDKRVSRNYRCVKEGCLLEAIEHYQKVLAGKARKSKIYVNDKSRALLFLGHFVGDLHQPMHVSYKDDWGGNAVKLTFKGERTNLHALWDRNIVSQKKVKWRSLGSKLYKAMQNSASRERSSWKNRDVHDWATESLTITRDIYHDLARYRAKKFHLEHAYFDRYNPVIMSRIKAAGYRLGAMLNRSLR